MYIDLRFYSTKITTFKIIANACLSTSNLYLQWQSSKYKTKGGYFWKYKRALTARQRYLPDTGKQKQPRGRGFVGSETRRIRNFPNRIRCSRVLTAPLTESVSPLFAHVLLYESVHSARGQKKGRIKRSIKNKRGTTRRT